MASLQKDFGQKIRFVAIGSESVGFEEFVQNKFFPEGEVYIDEQRTIQQQLSSLVSTSQLVKSALTWKSLLKIWNSDVPGNMQRGNQQYFADSVSVIGRGGKLYFKSIFQEVSDEVDLAQVSSACLRCQEDPQLVSDVKKQ